MSYTITQGEKTAEWLTDAWTNFWESFTSTNWNLELDTNWESLGG